MNGIMNMVYFVHLCWILSSVISVAFATSETVSASSVIFRSSLVSSRRTLLLPASEYAPSSSPLLSSSALSGNVKSQPSETITTEQISPTPIDAAEISLEDITMYSSSEDSQQIGRDPQISIESLSSSSVSSSFSNSGSLNSLISSTNPEKVMTSDLSPSLMTEIEPFSSGLIFSANLLKTAGSTTTEEDLISPSATESMSRPVSSETPYEVMPSPIKIDKDFSSGFSSFMQYTHKTRTAIEYSTFDKLMASASGVMSPPSFNSLAVISTALASVVDSLSVSSLLNSKKPDFSSLEESVLGRTLQNTDFDTNLFDETPTPLLLLTSHSASNELSSFAEITSLSQELILTSMDTVTPTSSVEYLSISGTMELSNLQSEFSVTNEEANITPSSFSELNFGSTSGKLTTITFVDSFSSGGQTILPEASTFVSNTVLEETSSTISSSVVHVSESSSPGTTSTSISSFFNKESTTIPSSSLHLELSPQNGATSVESTIVSPESTLLPKGSSTTSVKSLDIISTVKTSKSSTQDFERSLSHGISSISSSPANMSPLLLEEGTTTVSQLSSDLSVTLMNSQYETPPSSTFALFSSTVAGIEDTLFFTPTIPETSTVSQAFSSDSFMEQMRPTSLMSTEVVFESLHGERTILSTPQGSETSTTMSITESAMISEEPHTAKSQTESLAASSGEMTYVASSSFSLSQGEKLKTLSETFSSLDQRMSSAVDTVAMQSSSIGLSSVSVEFETVVLPSSFSELHVSALESAATPSASLEISSIVASLELSSLKAALWHSSSPETSASDIVPTPSVPSELTSIDTLATHSSSLEVTALETMVEHSLSLELSSVEKVVTSSLSFQLSPLETGTIVTHSLSPEFSSLASAEG